MAGVGAILWFQGTIIAQPTNVAFIFQFSRVFIALAGVVLLGERLTSREYVGVLLAIIGGFILTCSGGEIHVLNNFILFASAFFYAVSHILAKLYVKSVSPSSLAAGRTMFLFFILLIYSLALGRLEVKIPPEVVGWALLGAFSAPFLTVISYYEALKRVEISKVVAIISFQPFFTALYAVLFFAVFPSLKQIIGGSIVTLGVVILATSRRNKVSNSECKSDGKAASKS